MMDNLSRFTIMNPIEEKKQPSRIEIKHPSIHFIENFLYQKKSNSFRNNRMVSSKITKEIQFFFLERESYDRFKYQILCLDLEIEADHIGELSILRKQINVFNNIIVHANLNGKLVNVLNFEQLKKRWEVLKNELVLKYYGNVFLNYLKKTDILFENKETLLTHLNSKEMYGLYFNECWGIHKTDNPRFEGLEVNVNLDNNNSSEDIEYSNVQIITKMETELKKQSIEFHYIKNKLYEIIAEVVEETNSSKYSMICLTPII